MAATAIGLGPARVVIVSGPTATGKTDAVLELARRFPVDLISADAAQVYRGMDIGTAKPDRATLERFPHALIDIRDPDQVYSAAEFRCDAVAAIEASLARHRIPLVTGGTMFYLSALINGLSVLPRADARVRNAILELAEASGWQALHLELERIDPELAARIRPGDRQRLQRAHEIYRMTGRAPSQVMSASAPRPLPFPALHVALFHPRRDMLHERIESRFRAMLDQGLLEEVERLRTNPRLSAASVSMRTVGYRQAFEYLDRQVDFETFVQKAVAATRQLAKRQLTWLRATPGVVWMDASCSLTAAHLAGYIEARVDGARRRVGASASGV
ncbi:MAG: tRNA (adenosine(37)-N6)-dimethylallyltransferase MiaA [Proteobacteria bacterium]|nr:MAG: tRNA (adenosine(37)-N6)-dimethylallyltransferase MiaA [Pseudomonadota bacterium]